MIEILHKTIRAKKMQKHQHFKAGSWVYVEGPSKDEVKTLVSELGLDEHLIQDALDPYEAPRMEVDGKNLYIYSRVPVKRGSEVTTVPLLIVITDTFLVTISASKISVIKQIIANPRYVNTTQRLKLLLVLFSNINMVYATFLHDINRAARKNRVNLEHITNKDIVNLITAEEVLNDFLTALVPTYNVLEQILSSRHVKLHENDRDLAEDLLLSTNQLIDLSKSNLKSMVTIRDGYSTIMTNNLNRVIKMLTGITMLLTIPMIVSGFYGMNIALPFMGSPYAFWYIMGTTLLFSGILFAIFLRNKWF
jgi:magnesium transporter